MFEDSDEFVPPSEVADMEMIGTEPIEPEPSRGPLDGIVQALWNTEPDVSPREASGFVDLDVPWQNHLEVMFQKITSSGGVPAWLNGVAAVAAFAKQSGVADKVPDQEPEAEENSSDPEENLAMPDPEVLE